MTATDSARRKLEPSAKQGREPRAVLCSPLPQIGLCLALVVASYAWAGVSAATGVMIGGAVGWWLGRRDTGPTSDLSSPALERVLKACGASVLECTAEGRVQRSWGEVPLPLAQVNAVPACSPAVKEWWEAQSAPQKDAPDSENFDDHDLRVQLRMIGGGETRWLVVRTLPDGFHQVEQPSWPLPEQISQDNAEIIHEINNHLTNLVLRAQLIEKSLPSQSSPALLQHIQAMGIQARSVAEVVASMSRLSRQRADDAGVECDLCPILHDILPVVTPKAGSWEVDLSVPSRDELAGMKLVCHPRQISQILINLVTNSLYAVRHLPSRWVRIEVRYHGTWCDLVVVDSGQGLPDAVAERILQPYYTTKPVGEGTGLGLSLSLKIARANGGDLFLDRSATQTTFVLRIPNGRSDER